MNILAAGRHISLWCFLHKRQCVTCQILEKCYPEIMILHRRYQMWLVDEWYTSRLKLTHRYRETLEQAIR
jgi:hypothetical protein